MLWKVKSDGWLPTPTVIQAHRRTITGRLAKHRLRRDGQVVKLMDYKYIVRVSDYWGMTKLERWDALLDMLGQPVYLVDNLHCDEGIDHTPYVRQMYLSDISDIRNINVQLDPLYLTIELVDDSL
jgi:hypothetical protein